MSSGMRLLGKFMGFLVLFAVVLPGDRVFAANLATGGTPARQATLLVPYTQYEWWLMRWSDSRLMCQLYTDHDGWPLGQDIFASCGNDVYTQWKSTAACPEAEQGNVSSCLGLYLLLIGSQPAEKEILVDLPLMQVWVTLLGCEPTSPENFCSQIPSLLLTAEEPLPNEHITAVHAMLSGQTIDCLEGTCQIPLQVTPLQGVTIEFWADSSFGDSSQHYVAKVRVVDTGVADSPTESGWYVDVLSTQWRGAQIASCAQTWRVLPPVGGPPSWLSTPEVPSLLATDTAYFYLAGRLISQGLVDVSGCETGGLLQNGYADICGLEKAQPLVQEWQNRFDARITEVALETGVPSQLMKNLFALESQFWPGAFKDPKEFGLGQLTENGAETVLLWNPNFYNQFCPLVLEASTCQKGYLSLDDDQRATLRGALALQAKADCEDCPAGIDLANADFNIKLFAETLLANCEQVGQIVYNGTNHLAGEVSTYEDLWRFTIANYHAGPGCLSYAIYNTWDSGNPMDWAHVKSYLTPACQGVIPYVERITK